MSLKISGRFVVQYEDDNEVEQTVTVPAEHMEYETELHDGNRGMGEEWVHRVTAHAGDAGTFEWLVYEYPVGVLNMVDHPSDPSPGEIIEHPTFNIVAD